MKILLRIIKMCVIAAFLGCIVCGGYFYFQQNKTRWFPPPDPRVVLHGNVEERHVNLAFIVSDRIAAIYVQEGDSVVPGSLLARVDTTHFAHTVAQCQAALEMALANYERLCNGPRPEEIDIQKSVVIGARVACFNAEREFNRYKKLIETQAGAQQELDNAEVSLLRARTTLAAEQSQLDLLNAGYRREDIMYAHAQCEQARANLRIAEQQLFDAQIFSPDTCIVRTRLLEVGDMAGPSKAVFLLALTDPKWARVYISGPDLGAIRMGQAASVYIDTYPDSPFSGQIGYISPTAEFTPKYVQTEELRSALLYEVRVYIHDPQGLMKLGAPVTVYINRVENPIIL